MKLLLALVATTLVLTGCADPLSEKESAFVGLWKSNQTSLLITQSGRLEYESNSGSVTTTMSMPIKSIDESGIEAGFLFFTSSFTLQGQPGEEDGVLVLVLDGEKLYRADEFGRVPEATLTPPSNEMQPHAAESAARRRA